MHAASHELKYFYIHILSHIIVRYHALINAHSCENVISSLLRMEQKNIIQILRYAWPFDTISFLSTCILFYLFDSKMNFSSNKPFQFCFSSDSSQSSRKSVKSPDLRPSRGMLGVNLNPTFFFGGKFVSFDDGYEFGFSNGRYMTFPKIKCRL